MELTEDNWELYASKQYSKNKFVTTYDFKSDCARFRYIKQLFRRYYSDDELRERLILNHIIILGNVLGPKCTAEILMMLTDDIMKPIAKSFLVYLNYLPEDFYVEVPLDSGIVDALRSL